MLVPETSALPLGESPVYGTFIILPYSAGFLLLMLQLWYDETGWFYSSRTRGGDCNY
jgi:hypothetical protein